MKIVVIQRRPGHLVGIRDCVARLDEKRAEEIIYTSDPDEVLEAVRDGDPALVVSSLVLDSLKSGTDLARRVKQVNARTLFFIYSVMPEVNEAVHGVIPKENSKLATGEHSLLARILAGKLDGITPLDLKAEFPEITVSHLQ